MRIYRLCLPIVLVALTPAAADELALVVPPLVREALVQEVLLRNASLSAASAAETAAAERVTREGRLEQPVASYELAPLSLAEGRYGQVLTLRQSLPYPGARSLRSGLAAADLARERGSLETLRLDLALEASHLFDDYWLVERAIEINEEHLRLLEEFRAIATARYAASTATQQDPIQAEVEQSHLRHRAMRLGVERSTTIARINALLHREPEAALAAPPAERELPEHHSVTFEDLLASALARRPEIAMADAAIAARGQGHELARVEGKPDFEVMTSYNSMWDEREHRWMTGVAMKLPLWRKPVRAGVAETRAELGRAEAEREALGDAVRVEVYTASNRLEEAHHVAELYRSRLVPASRDQVQAALSAFRTGQSGFLSLIDAERNQRTVELDYLETLADIHRRRADLDRALGSSPGEPAP